MRIIHVLRKPLSEGTVAANTLKHGCGGINIDASRVGTEQVFTHSRGSNQAFPKRPGETSVEESGRKVRQDILDHAPRTGRWPANVILQHLDGCRRCGVKRVGAGEGSFVGEGGEVCEAHEGYKRPNSSSYTHKQPGHRKTFGEETVANWICESGCPVARLDEQSLAGGMHKAGNKQPPKHNVKHGFWTDGGWKPLDRNPDMYGDDGGASRFYKQVGGGKVPE